MEWNEIKGYNNKLSYQANKDKGVLLPNLNEYVLFCLEKEDKDFYFGGNIIERCGNYVIINVNELVDYAIQLNTNIIRWSYFERPKTKNNTGYAIAYQNKYGENFTKDIPYIVSFKDKTELDKRIEELEKKECKSIKVFEFFKPCTYQYTWDYINKNLVNEEIS